MDDRPTLKVHNRVVRLILATGGSGGGNGVGSGITSVMMSLPGNTQKLLW